MNLKKSTGALILLISLSFLPQAQGAPVTDARIAQLEKQIATMQGQINELKALQTQALYLKDCVAKEKSTNNLKVALKLASCTVEYFKKSKAVEAKAKK